LSAQGWPQICSTAGRRRDAAVITTPAHSLPNELSEVENRFIEQLRLMDWEHLKGDIDVPYLTERESFRDVLLLGRLRKAIKEINVNEAGEPWLDDSRLTHAIDDLQRLGEHKLLEANQVATNLLLSGTTVEGSPDMDGGRDQVVRFIDFENPARNDFLAINQFRIDRPGERGFITPDVVLFVNGIPVVVIECKSPAATNPMEEGITQLLRYSNQRDWLEEEEDEGAERLFHYNQLLVSTYFYEARVAAICAGYEHYLEWKDTCPVPSADVAVELGVDKLHSQQLLVAGMLRPETLLDVVRNFILFDYSEGRTIKIVPRYQQYRAVHRALDRLNTGTSRAQGAEHDGRGGVIWHTQGSGKSLTMVFLVRKMRTLPSLRRFKVVMVTDRIDLEKQLSGTATLTGETLRKARSTEALKEILREPGSDLVFATIQKYRQTDDAIQRTGEEHFPVLNTSEDVLVIVDEAHRSQSNMLHANLMRALPNAARVGFTGTPILAGEKKRTYEIFGQPIDTYTIKESEEDGATLPIIYEGRTAEGIVSDSVGLDQRFEDLFKERSEDDLAEIKAKYATSGDVLEAPKLIAAKAADMLRHYVDTVLPNGFKAQVVSASRRAAIRYREQFEKARDELVAELEGLGPDLLDLADEQLEELGEEEQFLVRAHAQLDLIRELEFATVISKKHNQPSSWSEWSDKAKSQARIDRFKKPLADDKLAFLCVKSMLLTGFDAPVEQVLYLDRAMRGHELLQAIARVNRTKLGKTTGLVVDYYGVARHLKDALAVYTQSDVEGALTSIKDELPKLADRNRRAIDVFVGRGLDIDDIDGCVELLRDVKIRADFIEKLKKFTETLDVILPRPEALPFVRDAKLLGFINKAAHNLYRDSQLNIIGAGNKVKKLIDEFIESQGVDPRIPPISILDARFEETVDAHTSTRTKASEMEHAARHHIRVHFEEDPVYFESLSERLEGILDEFHDRWDELVDALKDFTEEVKEGRRGDETGLDPKTELPFLDILLSEASNGGAPTDEEVGRYAELTVELVEHLRQEVRNVDFWRNAHAQNVLRAWIVRDFLDEHDLVPFDRQQTVADRLVELAKALHVRLQA
jgi:type I restriction enzyme R subunit